MTTVYAVVDIWDFAAGVQKLKKVISGESNTGSSLAGLVSKGGSLSTARGIVTEIAQEIMADSRKYVPRGFANETGISEPLVLSGFIEAESFVGAGFSTRKSDAVKFGYRKPYAAFQDQPTQQAGSVTVRRVRKKCLFIPRTKYARLRHVYGANPTDEGLRYSDDYTLAESATISIKGYGSIIGPNHYFSGTFRNWSKKVFPYIAQKINAKLNAYFGMSKGSGGGK